jgi:hypothetical protein
MIQLYTNAQDHLQQSVQREFEAQKQIEALRHQIEELIVLSQPQIDRVSALESENERLNVLVQEKDIQIKSKESLINQLKADAQKAEELAQMEKHLESTTKEAEVLKKEIKLKTIQHRKWVAKTETLDAQIKNEQEKIAELEKILANRKEPNEIEREILRMQYSIEERDHIICDREREIASRTEEIEQLKLELERTKILLKQAQDEAKQKQENYEMKIIRLEQRLKVKRHEARVHHTNNSNANAEEDVLQMPVHKPIEAPTDLVNHSMDISNHTSSLIDEIFGSDVVMDEPSNGTSTADSSPDHSIHMNDITEVVEEGTIVPKKSQSDLAKRADESEAEHVQRVVSMFLGFMPLNHTYLQASRYLKNYSSEDIAKTIFHMIEQRIEMTPNESLNYKRTLYFASHLSKAKPGFLDILTELIHSEVLANFKPQFSELFFNIATLTHQYHFIYEIVFNWLAQQSSLELPTILQLGVKYLPAPKEESDEATEALFWTLCIIVYRTEIEDLKKEISEKVENLNVAEKIELDVEKKEDEGIFKILELMVEPSSTQFYAMVLESVIKFGGQQILSQILSNACKLTEHNDDADVQKTFHNILKTILTKNTFLFSFHRKLPFWLQLIVAQVLVENIIEADDNYEIFVQRLSLWREFLDEEQKNSLPEELTNYLNVVENFVQKKY